MAEIFVFLPAHRDADREAADFSRGIAADRSPWGFGHARGMGHRVKFSAGRAKTLVQRCWFRVLQCDVFHAWRCRNELRAAKVIWTHTEREYLAAAFVLRLMGARGPILVGNTIWLFHDFAKTSALYRRFIKFCLARVDILTCNAVPNTQGIDRSKPVAYVPFGISTESFPLTKPVVRKGRFVVAIGNDRARNWRALRDVATQHPDVTLRIASTVTRDAPSDLPNVEVAPTTSVEQTRELYRRADIVLVPVTANWHASGITVVLEAVASGVPVVAAKEGGLEDYFTDQEILFYGPDQAVQTAADAVGDCLRAPDVAAERARRAQVRFRSSGYDSESFIRRLLDVTGTGATEQRAA